MDVVLEDVRQPHDWRDFHAIRRVELFEARGRFGIYNDRHPDDHADFAYPLLLKRGAQPLGVARLDLLEDGRGAIRLVAITAAEQRRGYGKVMEQLIAERARALGLHTLLVNAAEGAVGFYRKTGWAPFDWDASELVGSAVPCIQMRKLL